MSRVAMSGEERAKRRRAYILMRKALRSGVLVRDTSCANCQPLHGHHRYGYDRPLDVVWLCQSHHSQEHYALTHGAAVVGDQVVPPPPTPDEAMVGYYEFLIHEADQRIVEWKQELKIARARATRARRKAERDAA